MDLPYKLMRLRAPTVATGDGTLEPNWSTPEDQWTKTEYWGSLQPVGSKEDLQAQNRLETTHISRVEPSADITGVDRIRFRGKDYTVDGEPGDFSDVELYGGQAHWKVFLKRITGG